MVVVHPLVLLSVVDHFTRKDTKKRVVGVLLGTVHKGKVDVTNSYAVPFEEDPKNPAIWYLDHNYHENMYAMFKKVNAKEKVIGWYSTGPKIRPADIDINELFRRYTAEPVMCIINVNPQDDVEIPVEAYASVESAAQDKGTSRRTLVHLPSEIGAYEAEEVGVEHLVRNIVDNTTGTVAGRVAAKVASLKGLHKRMEEMRDYLDKVCAGKMPIDHQIVYNFQDILNLIPNLKLDHVVKAFAVKTNDNMLTVYLSSLIRSILALHDLINNKLENRQLELKDEEEKEKRKEEKREAAAAAALAKKATADKKKDEDAAGDKMEDDNNE